MTNLTKMVAVAAGVAGVAYWIMKDRENDCFSCTRLVESGLDTMGGATERKYICIQCAVKAVELYPIRVAKLLEGMANPANGEQERAIISHRLQLLQAQTNELAIRAGLTERV